MNIEQYILDIITESRHYAFRKVLPGYPQDADEAVYRIAKGNEFDPAKASSSRNLNNPRSQSSAGEHMSEEVADDYDFYVIDIKATKALRERLILSGEDIFRFQGKQYRPARLGERHALVVSHNDVAFPVIKGGYTEASVSNRYYVLREIQQSEPEESLDRAVRILASAIVNSIKEAK